MAKTLQHRRDTTTNLASIIGAAGEIFMDTTKNTLVVMDGVTAGGHPLALEGAGSSYGNTDVATYLGDVGTFRLGQDGFVSSRVELTGDSLNFTACSYVRISTTAAWQSDAAIILDSSNGNVYIPRGNLITTGIKTDNYFYANGAAVSFGGGGGGGGSTGDFTFTANTVSVSSGNTAVFNTSGFETTTLANPDFWQISNLFHTGAPGGGDPNYSYLKVWENPVFGSQTLRAEALEVIATLTAQLTPGMTLTVVTQAAGTFTGTIDSIETGIGDPGNGQYIKIIFVEDFVGSSGTYNQSFSFDTPISGQFTMDTDGTFITDTLLAGDLFVANNIITPVTGGAYGATVQPVVVNGDLSVLGKLNPDTPEYEFFSGIVATPNDFTGIEYRVTERNQKHVFLAPSMDGDSYYVNVYLPNNNEVGDTYEFVMYRNTALVGNGSSSTSLQVNLNTGTTNGSQDLLEYWNGSAFVTREQKAFGPSSDKTSLMVKAVYVGYNRWTYFVTESNNSY